MSSIKITSVLVLSLSIMAGGCMAREIKVNVVVFNYTSRPLVDMTVNGYYVGGYFQEYGPGGAGGGVYCCIDVKPGAITAAWEIGWPVDEPLPSSGLKRTTTAIVPEDKGGHKYLGVHIYPDDQVELTLTRDIPPEKKEGEP